MLQAPLHACANGGDALRARCHGDHQVTISALTAELSGELTGELTPIGRDHRLSHDPRAAPKCCAASRSHPDLVLTPS